jgi:hypothetical protein
MVIPFDFGILFIIGSQSLRSRNFGLSSVILMDFELRIINVCVNLEYAVV